MSNVAFWDVPLYGHINPTLRLVEELTNRGENITYYSTITFKQKIENAGAKFKYESACDCFCKAIVDSQTNSDPTAYIRLINTTLSLIDSAIKFMIQENIINKYDYIVYGSLLPYGRILSQILHIPSVSLFAVFATLEEMTQSYKTIDYQQLSNIFDNTCYNSIKQQISKKYNYILPEFQRLLFNPGQLNIMFTSKSFIKSPHLYDSSYVFVGPANTPPDDTVAFPFDKLNGHKILYISLGTIFGTNAIQLYETFIEAFKKSEYLVVMPMHNIAISNINIPNNFIVQDFVPQTRLLEYIDVAIVHGGSNTTNDMILSNIPFVVIPLGGDQLYTGKRCEELGVSICLDKDKLTSLQIREAIESVANNPKYKKYISVLRKSFLESGGYKRASNEIFNMLSKFKRE